MKEHREPFSLDAPGPESSRPRQLPAPSVSPRPPNPARMRRAAGVAAVVLALAALIGSGALGNLRDWVHGQPDYVWTLEDLQLDPEPPPWIRSGAAGLIKGARREGLGRFEGGSLLDLDPAAVERAFKKLAWVDEVITVQRSYPNRVRVQLRYRRPVARINSPQPGPARDITYFVDENAVILPNGDLDASAVPAWIKLHDPSRPYDGNPGRVWQRPNASQDGGEPDRSTIAAARLAGFLLGKHREQGWPANEAGQPLRMILIARPPGPYPEPKLYVLTDVGTWIFWNEPPGEEAPGRPTAEQKWETLRDWLGRNDPTPQHKEDRLYFSRQGVRWDRHQPRGPPS
ncbi:hypothetical protein BH23PLA1_BH23PLA1_09390 [soil metagenome]